MLFSAAACGQVGGSIVAESDYRYRGISLNGEDPTLHVSLAYDDPRGWYAGASLAHVELEPGAKRAAATAYAGFVRRRATGWAWEAGATLNHFGGDAGHDYAEAFGGILAEGWSARLYYAPRYFGGSVRTLLADASPPHYVAIMGYVPFSSQFDDAISELRATIREATRSSTSYGSLAQSAVMASSAVTALITTGC